MYGTIASGSSSARSGKHDDALVPPPVAPSPFRYEVQTGDTLASIAAKMSTTEARLRELNPMLAPVGSSSSKKHPRVKVYPGQQLVVEEARQVSLPPPPDFIDNGWGQMHLVRSGETLKSIAAQYNTSEELLRQDNRQHFPAGERGVLFPGQLLHVRIVNTGDMEDLRDQHSAESNDDGYNAGGATYASSSATYSKYKTHLIEKKDTFESICKAYSITYARLLQINRGRYPVGARAELVVGERLIVPDLYASQQEASRRNVAEVKLTKQIHVVERDETPESIAAKYRMTYDEIREFNRAYFPKGFRGEIREGYKLVVKRLERDDEYQSIDDYRP